MAQKTDFTADEWKTILASPMLAGMAVTLAEGGDGNVGWPECRP